MEIKDVQFYGIISVESCHEGYDLIGNCLTEIRYTDDGGEEGRESPYMKFRYRIIHGKPEIEYIMPLIDGHRNNIESKTGFCASYFNGKLEVDSCGINGATEFTEIGLASLQQFKDELMEAADRILQGGDGIFNLCKLRPGKRKILSGIVS